MQQILKTEQKIVACTFSSLQILVYNVKAKKKEE